MERVSVVIPARNAASFLHEALASVRAQGLSDAEVVVVDDGSTDGTGDAARAFGGARVIRQEASGSGRARNAGLRATSGDLIAFLDADDVWAADKSAAQLALLASDPALAMVFSDMVDFEGERLSPTTYFQNRAFDGRCAPSSIFLYDMVSTPTVILRRACLDDVGMFDESLPIGQDTDLWFRIALRHRFGCVPRPLVRRRLHPGNVTRNSRLLARCVDEIWGRYLEDCIRHEPERAGALRADYARKRWGHLFVEGCALLHEGQAPEGRRMLAQAIGVAPWSPRPYAFYLASLLGMGSSREAAK